MDEILKSTDQKFKEILFSLCESGQSLQLKKIFLNLTLKSRLNSENLCSSLFAGILGEQPKSISTILDIAEKLKIELKTRDLSPVFNLLIQKKEDNFLLHLEEKYNIIKRDFNQEGLLDLQNGKIYQGGGFSESYDTYIPTPVEEKQRGYWGNVLSNNLNNASHLTYLLNKEFLLNSNFAQELFLNVCLNKNIEIAKILLTHEKTKEAIVGSYEILEYLNEPTENKEFKDEIKKIMKSLEIAEILDNSLEPKNKEKKHKI